MRPSALASPGGWKMCTLPSRLVVTLRPMRASTVGSCASAGRYSFRTIDGGTFQVGFTVMNFIVSVICGVAVAGLPTTTRVVQISLPLCITRSV